MIMLQWYTVYIIVGVEWRDTCMDFYALGRIISANLESLSLFYKAIENQEIRSKRALCPELEKSNFNVDWGVVAGGAGKE